MADFLTSNRISDPRLKDSSPYVQNTEVLLQQARDLHKILVEHLAEVTRRIEGDMASQDLADIGFLCREIGSVLDECRKDANARMELAGKILATRLIQASLADASNQTMDVTVHGRVCSATACSKLEPQMPEFGSPDYYSFMSHFGISKELADIGVVKPHWPKLSEYLTSQAEAGKRPPPGVGQPRTKFFCSYRKKR